METTRPGLVGLVWRAQSESPGRTKTVRETYPVLEWAIGVEFRKS